VCVYFLMVSVSPAWMRSGLLGRCDRLRFITLNMEQSPIEGLYTAPSLRQPECVPVFLPVPEARTVMNDCLRWPMPPLSYGGPWTSQTIPWIPPQPSTLPITHRTLRHKRDRQHVSRASDRRHFNGFSDC